jgi:IS5 family transposase
LTEKVIDQAERRVIRNETVDAQDKVVSIFEPHADIIVKDNLDTHFGHKICLTGGASNLILDCWILEGNPADTDLAIPMLDRQKEIYRQLRRFRAGIESGISWLKRCLGLTRCNWKNWGSFKSYVWSSIVAANLLTILRLSHRFCSPTGRKKGHLWIGTG